jgi:CDGSH-type Zn-finger protein
MVELKKGETNAWCACGRSANQPWCDGSHHGSGFSPKVFVMDESKPVYMCMCKQTKTPPFCDGTHKKLEE